jgi:hypothetical protein
MKQVRDVLQLHSVMNLSLRRIQGATRVTKSTAKWMRVINSILFL